MMLGMCCRAAKRYDMCLPGNCCVHCCHEALAQQCGRCCHKREQPCPWQWQPHRPLLLCIEQ